VATPKIVLFYAFTPLGDPEAMRLWQRDLAESLHLRGRVLVSHQGLNGTLGGDLPDVKRWLKKTRQHPALAGLDVPVLRTVSDDGTVEGADALWVRPDLVLVGTGNRTNASGLRQLAEVLAPSGVYVVGVPLPSRVQHLLGVLQLVDRDLAVVRGELLGPEARAVLSGAGVGLIELPETPEVGHAQAMNFVTLAPRRILLADDVPGTRRLLERAGVEAAGTVRVAELRKAAGGLAYATGILARDPAPGP